MLELLRAIVPAEPSALRLKPSATESLSIPSLIQRPTSDEMSIALTTCFLSLDKTTAIWLPTSKFPIMLPSFLASTMSKCCGSFPGTIKSRIESVPSAPANPKTTVSFLENLTSVLS